MRKLFVLLLIVLLPGALAITTDMESSYKPGETAIFKIQGNILDSIGFEDISFLREGHIEVPFDYDIQRIEGVYYVYAVMPYLEDNQTAEYSLLIEDISTTEKGQNVEIDFEKNFSVSGETAIYTITPGFISTSEDFEIDIVLNRDLEESVEIDFPDERELILKPGENSILFDTEGVSGGFYEIKIGNYLVPVYIIKEKIERERIIFDPKEIESVILVGSEEEWRFKIINTGDDINEFSFDYDPDVLEIRNIPLVLKSGEVYLFEIILKSEGSIDEMIYFDYLDERVAFPVRIDYTENEEEVVYEEEDPGFSCEELNGQICFSGEECSGNTVSSSDGTCCLGQCTQEDSGGSLAWVGWVLGFILVVALLFIGIKYFRTRKDKGKDEFKKRIKKAEGPIPIF